MKTERHGYKFTNKQNAKGGIASVVLAVVSLVLVGTGIWVSFQKEGNAGIIVGALGTGAFFISIFGMIVGLKSFKEREKFYLFSWIGSIANGILWLAMCFIIGWGMLAV